MRCCWPSAARGPTTGSACAIEDAGWEIRDCLMWLYGQGFPKAPDIGVMIDKAKGAQREVVGTKLGQPGYSLADNGRTNEVYGDLHNPGGRVRHHGPGDGVGEAVDRLGQRPQAGLGADHPGDEAAGRHAGPQRRNVGRGRHEHQCQRGSAWRAPSAHATPGRSLTPAGSVSTGRLSAARRAADGRRICCWTKRRRPCSTHKPARSPAA